MRKRLAEKNGKKFVPLKKYPGHPRRRRAIIGSPKLDNKANAGLVQQLAMIAGGRPRWHGLGPRYKSIFTLHAEAKKLKRKTRRSR